MNKVTSIKKGEKTLETIVEDSSMDFKSIEDGLNLLSFSIGLIGIFVGTVLGLLLALNIESVISGIETILGFQFFPKDVFYINRFPSVIQLNDVLSVVIGAIILAVIAAN